MLVLIEISHAVKLTYFSIKLQYVNRTAQNCSCDPDNIK